MRRIALLIAATVALGAACAASASASPGEFIATQHAPEREFPSKGVSGTAGHQELQLGPFTVSCAVARSANMVAHQSETLPVDVSLTHCTVPVQIAGKTIPVAANVEEPLELAYNATSGDAQLLDDVAIEIRKMDCQATVERGSLSSGLEGEAPFEEALVSTSRLRQFPSGVQKKLWIHSREEGIHYQFLGKCFPLFGEDGVYRGTLSDEVPDGNLSYVAPVEEGWNIITNKEG
ncbi:MAG TPA: hypothetical protein VNV44_00785 [Solirubrobacteraceae bacterium]|jgi:hypothetical protein|nr:hypothetical protein [Solirubrobacteraceae bacterium]